MQNFARLAKAGSRAAVPVAAGVVATANQPVAHADSYQASDVLSPRRIQDGWELAEFEGKDILFKPEEIDDALAFLSGKPQQPTASAVIEELDSELSSDGTVDAVIEHSYGRGYQPAVSNIGLPLDLQELCTVAGKLLKSPGVQREILSAAVTDPEVFSILASKMDLPEYLEAAGFAAKGLLTGPQGDGETGSAASSSGSNCIVVSESASSAPAVLENPFAQLSANIGEGVEQLGYAVARVGRWLRTQLTGQDEAAEQAAAAQASESAAAGGPQQHAGRGANKAAARVMSAVMVICVAVVALVVLRRPSALRGLFRRRTAV